MAHATAQGRNLLYGFKRATRFDKGLGSLLPDEYRKFWREWKVQKPAAVHYIPKSSELERDELTGHIKPVQDLPIPLIDTPESHEGIWGGEAVIKGFQKRHPTKRRVPYFWVPTLRRTVLYSKVLDEYISMVVTQRTMDKIHDSYGFDHYLLKNPACDLRSGIALKLKRQILQELLDGCPSWHKNARERVQVLKEYKRYLDAYTPKEIEWYGYTYKEAIQKLQAQLRAENPVIPHKVEFRLKLIEQLKAAGIREAMPAQTTSVAAAAAAQTTTSAAAEDDADALKKLTESDSSSTTASSSWLSKMNPFGKKET